MGYYSEVTITMKESDCKNFLALLQTGNDEVVRGARAVIQGVDEVLLKASTHGQAIITFHWSYIKWYEDFASINFIMNYLNDIDHRFVRMGEEFGDIEDELVGDDYDCDLVSPTQYINIDGTGDPIDLNSLFTEDSQEEIEAPTEDSVDDLLGG